MKKLTALLLYILFSIPVTGQTLFWSDTFEDTNAPTVGSTRTGEVNTGSGDSYFLRTNGTGIVTNNAYSGKEGNKFWAGEDHDLISPPAKAELKIDFTGINITGKSSIEFRGLFAANNGVAWEHINFASHTDFMIVEYRVNSGTYQTLLNFRSNNNTNRQLCVDNDGDGFGDGTPLNYTFAQITKVFSVSGTTLDLRIRVSANGGGEEWAIDNFRLYGLSPLPVKLLSFTATPGNGVNRLNWSTATEKDNAYFDVENSVDGITFNTLETKQAQGDGSLEQHYSAEHNNPSPGKNYYRLKIVATSGDYSYSPVVSLFNEVKEQIHVSPNPFTNIISIALNHHTDLDPVITLSNINGATHRLEYTMLGGVYNCNVTSLPKGTYMLNVNSGGTVTRRLLVK